jgi:hypothetical protein
MYMYAVHAQFNTCTCAYNVTYMYMSHMLYMYSVHEIHVHVYKRCTVPGEGQQYREKVNSIGRRPTV